MRVLMINKYLYPRAGAETYMLTVAQELISRGHTVGFFGMDNPDICLPGPASTILPVDFKTGQSKVSKATSLLKAGLRSVSGRAYKKLNDFVSEFKPDIIHAHNIYNQLPPDITKSIKDIPVLMTVHDFKMICPSYNLFVDERLCKRCLSGKFYNCVLHRCCHKKTLDSILATLSAYKHKFSQTYNKYYNCLITPSNFMKQCLDEGGYGDIKTCVVNNFATIPQQDSLPGNGILYFGRLCREKGIDTLLKAYAELDTPRPTLTIAGQGPLEGQLKQFAKDNDLKGIQWLGLVSPSQIQNELDKCGFVVVPSLWNENCSMCIMESLAHGRVVVASDSGGNPELIDDGINGRIFRAGDADALNEIIVELTSDPELLVEMGQAAKQHAKKRFSPEIHMQELLSVYESLIDKDCVNSKSSTKRELKA